jgi:hypothetical protein
MLNLLALLLDDFHLWGAGVFDHSNIAVAGDKLGHPHVRDDSQEKSNGKGDPDIEEVQKARARIVHSLVAEMANNQPLIFERS